MSDNRNIWKKFLLEFIDFIRFKIENDSMTMEDMDSIAKMFQRNTSLRES